MNEDGLVTATPSQMGPARRLNLQEINESFQRACAAYNQALKIVNHPGPYTGDQDCIRPYSPSAEMRATARTALNQAFGDISSLLAPTTQLKIVRGPQGKRPFEESYNLVMGTWEGNYSFVKEIQTLDREGDRRYIAGLVRNMNVDALTQRQNQWTHRIAEVFEGRAKWSIKRFDYDGIEMTVLPGDPFFGEMKISYEFHYSTLLLDRWGLRIVQHPLANVNPPSAEVPLLERRT